MNRQQLMTLQCIEDAAHHVRHYQAELDLRILEAVDAGCPYRVLGDRLGISKAAAFYRVERLLAR